MLIHHLHVISCSSHGSFASRLLLPVSTSSVKIKSVKYIFLWSQQNCFINASSQAIRSLSVNISIHLIDLGNSGKEICYRYSENSFYLMKTLWLLYAIIYTYTFDDREYLNENRKVLHILFTINFEVFTSWKFINKLTDN